ncbi:Calx-beta domain-containing protein [Caenimonas aquaedulcis]|uniref:DUF4214 domain-containing protein n=1 Tax=Caenimonas aquaedulcis TaxID=2793270 RepID=A0A931H867_9BURK|nr:DUF4214 domain-containing protein [Caenimonas aquaedulcis]MBG9390128.1 DUF4214 domain-containing protein [Caenimonas aquaedulcis]
MTYSLSPGAFFVSESRESINLYVTRTDASGFGTVYLSAVDSEGSTNQLDHNFTTTIALNFYPGQMVLPVTLPIRRDEVPEPQESFALVLKAQADATEWIAKSVFTIVDDDPPPANKPPVVFSDAGAGTYDPARSVSVSNLFNPLDLDGSVTTVNVSQPAAGTDGGYLTLDGVPVGALAVTLPLADLPRLAYRTGDHSGIAELFMTATDNLGASGSGFVALGVWGNANQPPVIVAQDEQLWTAHTTVPLSLLFGISDAEGGLAKIMITEGAPGTDGGYLTFYDEPVTGGTLTVTPFEFPFVAYRTGTSSGSNTLSVEAFDAQGLSTSGSASLRVAGVAASPPVVFSPVTSVEHAHTYRLDELFTVLDPDVGDTISQYLVVVGANSGTLLQHGVAVAGTLYVPGTELATLSLRTTAGDTSISLVLEAWDSEGRHGNGYLKAGGDGADALVASDFAHSTLIGGAGNDTLTAGQDADFLRGDAGVDVGIYSGPAANFAVTRSDLHNVFVRDLSTDVVDIVTDLEFLHFDDSKLAMDLSGPAGDTVKLLGALFGAQAVHDKGYVGIGLALFDSGLSALQVAALAVESSVFQQLAGSASDTNFVQRVYANVTGGPPTAAELAYFLQLLDSGASTKADLAWMAAGHPYNLANIDFAGLANSGVEFV